MQANNYSIKYWSKQERPREKLLSKSPNALSDTELLAILLGTGTREKTAVDLSRELLAGSKYSLLELGKKSIRELMKTKGVGAARATALAAAFELGRRRQAALPLQKSTMKESSDVATYLQIRLRDYRQEVFAVLFLNQANRINHFEIISMGGISGTVADPRIILKKALEEDAVAIILSHNHPSGQLKPSHADEEITRRIKSAAALFDIKVLDHVIVSEEGYYSFADHGML